MHKSVIVFILNDPILIELVGPARSMRVGVIQVRRELREGAISGFPLFGGNLQADQVARQLTLGRN